MVTDLMITSMKPSQIAWNGWNEWAFIQVFMKPRQEVSWKFAGPSYLTGPGKLNLETCRIHDAQSSPQSQISKRPRF
jgi:hypothetical protein